MTQHIKVMIVIMSIIEIKQLLGLPVIHKIFRAICVLADLDPDYTYLKMTKAIKSDIKQLRRNYYKKQKPERENRPGRYRLEF